MTKTIQITGKAFDKLREDADYAGGLQAGCNYDIIDTGGTIFHAYTPDGIGCVYYNSAEERRQDTE